MKTRTISVFREEILKMIDYSKWTERKEKVSNLLIDQINPRFSHTKGKLSQNELINEMIENYKIYDLAKSISEGYFPDKNIIVVKENNKLVVLEGNRRVSALKTLIYPDLVIGSEKNKIKKLSDQVEKSYIKKINIIVAPSREAANPIIFKEHTENTTMKWSRIMQAEFYVRQLNSMMTPDKLAQEYHQKKTDINKVMKLYCMYNIATAIKYDTEDIERIVRDKQNFNASTLERIYDSKKMRDFLGITFDNLGSVHGQKDKLSFEKAYKKIITDIVQDTINTRKLNSEKDFAKYLNKIKKVKPEKKGTFTYLDFVKGDKAAVVNQAQAKKIIKSTRRSSGIITMGIPFALKGASHLKDNYDELKKLPVKSYPNTAHF